MERKRNRVEIMHDMLKIIQERGGKIKKTHLMYKANLSHKQMKAYLNELMKNSLIDKDESDSKTLLCITKKGRDFFIQYTQIRAFEKTFGL